MIALRVALLLVVGACTAPNIQPVLPDAPVTCSEGAELDDQALVSLPYCSRLGCGPETVVDSHGLPDRTCYLTGALCYCCKGGAPRPCLPEPQ